MHEHETSPSAPSPAGSISRRLFLGNMAASAASASILGADAALAADQPAPASKPIQRKIKLGLIGCGGRGNWITNFFKKHGGYEIHAVADYFQEPADQFGNAHGVNKSRRFSGLSGYKRLLESGVEAVAIEDVPYFYPEEAKAAVEAGIHVYMAKPIATDVPGCLMVEAAGKLATQKKLAFVVDYQLPTEPANIEVANRIRAGALGRLAHILSYGICWQAWPDPPLGPNIESRLRNEIWLSDIALGGDNIVSYDIHIVDGVTWVMGRRPAAACGRSRICRPNPHGDRSDCSGTVFEYDDGVIWTHVTQSINNQSDLTTLCASFYGAAATGHIAYGGKVFVRGGAKHYVGTIGSVFDQGVVHNVADFYSAVTEGHFENPSVKRAVDGTLAAILGREASARGRYLTMEELIKENKKLPANLTGMKT